MLPKYASTPLVWLLTVAVACFISIACATEQDKEQTRSEPEQKKEEQAEPAGKAAEEVKVYTNEDLQKMFGIGESAKSVAPAADEPAAERKPVMEVRVEPEPGEKPSGDPLVLMQQEKAMEEARTRAIGEAELAVADARERVNQLEQRILALRNPFSARPEIPEEEKADWEAMGTADRVRTSEEQLAQAREDLEAAERELAAIR